MTTRGTAPGTRTSLLLVSLLLVLGALSGSCGSSEPSQRHAPETSDALERLRNRIGAEHDDDDGAELASIEVPAPRPDDEEGDLPDYTRLAPRYGGALPDDDPRVLGVFRFRESPDPIIDGDTVAVVGLDASLRLVGIDAEETFRSHPQDRRRAYTDFEGYVRDVYAEAEGLPKFGTPLGEMAKEFARQFFAGDVQVRLEYDELDRTRGYYDRHLVYVYGMRDGQWVNYNLECVRAGMSPYFTKYGYSARFHNEFLEAEAEAREAQRGIWAPDLRHYPDYPLRRAWWDTRADAVAYFQQTYGDDPGYFEIATDTDWTRLAEYEGQEITVFATIGDMRFDYDPPRIYLSHRRGNDFQLVGFRAGVFDTIDWDRFVGGYVYVRGRLGFYRGNPQFVVDRGIEVWTEP